MENKSSQHTCATWISRGCHKIWQRHILCPGLAHSSLISTRKIFYAGCKVVFDKYECRVYYGGNLVLSGERDETTGLWKLPVNPLQPDRSITTSLDLELIQDHHIHCAANATPNYSANNNESQIMGDHQQANNLYTLPYKQNQLKFMHQTFSTRC